MGEYKRYCKILLLFLILLAFLSVPLYWFGYDRVYAAKEVSEVVFLDVGQGDAILIKTPFGQNILIDGGENDSIIKRLEENISWWDRTIDLMVLTHPHDDHVGGLIPVLERYRVKRAAYTGVLHDSPAFLRWLDLIESRSIPLTIIDRPQKVVFGEGAYLDIIYPQKSLLKKEAANLNNTSIVAKFIHGENSFLLMGDAEEEVERELLGLSALKADVLKAGHHGSITSSSERFLEAVLPAYAVIQCGRDNEFGHPSRRVIKRLKRAGCQILRNDEAGSVKMISNGENIAVR